MTDTRRPRLDAPDLPGYTYVRRLGSGGFSEVYLYRQHMPNREVAVKVLLQGPSSDGGTQNFADEANMTASLASHPSIVTIHHADIAADGRPYLVMEYYPSENLRVRAQRERLSVATVLSYGVQIACAVETAHRAGILHRDIKPANILVNSFNIPGLADFGIAATVAEAANESDDAAGLSIPWSPPEVLRSAGSSDERSDVYSLGATLYTLLTGRSPFEVRGQRNTSHDLMRRIESEPPQPLRRPDVPVSLERLLGQAMAKAPAARPPSALAFAQSLQSVESELGLPITPLVIMQQPSPTREREPEDEAATRLRPADRVVQAQGPVASGAEPDRTRRSPGRALSPQPAPAAGGVLDGVDGLTTRRQDLPASRPEARPEARHDATRTRDELRAMETAFDTRLTGRTAPEPFPGAAAEPVRTAEPVVAPSGSFLPPRVDTTYRRGSDAGRGPGRVVAAGSPGVPDGSAGEDGVAAGRRRGPRAAVLALVAAVAVGGLGFAAYRATLGDKDGARHPVAGQTGQGGLAGTGADPGSNGSALIEKPDPVQDLRVRSSKGGRVFKVSWENPDPKPGDQYWWRRTDPGHETSADYTTSTRVTLTDVGKGDRPCVEVVVVRGGEGSPPVAACGKP